jgi:hypothetical protein
MKKIEIKRTITTVAISTIVVFFADIIEDGVVDSPGTHYQFKVPKGKKLFEALAIGFGTALVIDMVVEIIKNRFKTETEKQLEELVNRDLDAIDKGILKTGGPAKIVWKRPAMV